MKRGISSGGSKRIINGLTVGSGKRKGNSNDVIDLCNSSPDNFPPKYLTGSLLQTHLDSHPNTGIKFEELIDKSQVQKVILTSFAVELPWLRSQLPPNISVCLVEHWSTTTSEEGNRLVEPNFMVCHPPLRGRQNMHAKLLLFLYPEFLRVVVTSANLVSYDWSLIENVLYVQDFPRATHHQPPKKPKTEDITRELPFKRDLRTFLHQLKVPTTVLDILEPFDFSRSQVELVTSVPGTHNGTGHGRLSLGAKLRDLIPSIKSASQASLLYQTSSLGSLTHQAVQSFWDAVYPSLAGQPPDLKLVFPSTETVLDSRLGTNGGGTIFFNASNYDTTFPKHTLHDAIALREGTLSHSKIIEGTFTPTTPSVTTRPVRWLYCGSHNFSAAAWGTTPQKSRPTLTLTNYELGIIALDPNFTLPFLTPPPQYPSNGRPWIQPDLVARFQRKT